MDANQPPMLPSKGNREFRDPDKARVMVDRFVKLCERVEFGVIRVEVANGVAKDVRVIHQDFRLDLTDPTNRDIIKPATGSPHDGGSDK